MGNGNGSFSVGAGIQVDAAAACDRVKDELRGEVTALRGKLQGLQDEWRGAGGTAFQDVMARWDADSSKLFGALEEFASGLRSSNDQYGTVDDSERANITKVMDNNPATRFGGLGG